MTLFGTDISLYKGNSKGLIFYFSYRLAHWTTKNKFLHLICCPLWITYRLIFNWILGIDVSEFVTIGSNLIVWHGIGLIVHPSTIIGDNVILRHNTTIGDAKNDGMAPIIESGVEIGTGAIILGGITIGRNSIIGAGAVVTKSCPPYSVIIGNPGKIIRIHQ